MNFVKENTVSFDVQLNCMELERVLIQAIEQKYPEFSTRYECKVEFHIDSDGTLKGASVEGAALQSTVDGFLKSHKAD